MSTSHNGNTQQPSDSFDFQLGVLPAHSSSASRSSARPSSYNNPSYGSSPASHRRGASNFDQDPGAEHSEYDTHHYGSGHSSHNQYPPQGHYNSRHPSDPPASRRGQRVFDFKPAKNRWIYSSKELSTLTPSVLDGMSHEDELLNRRKGVLFIVSAGRLLSLNNMVIYAASTFFHRFYLRKSLKYYHHYNMAATCLFLATKVEESIRKLRNVTIACAKVASKDSKLQIDEQSRDFWQWKDTILVNEEILLEALTFDLTLDSPYAMLSEIVGKLKLPQEFCKGLWAFVNDSCFTPLCIMYPTNVILAAGIQWGSKLKKLDIPEVVDELSGEKVNWMEHSCLGVNPDDVNEACEIMVAFYEMQTNNTGVRASLGYGTAESHENEDSVDEGGPPQKKSKHH